MAAAKEEGMERSRMLEEARRNVPEVNAAQSKAEVNENKVAVLLAVREIFQ